MPDPLLFRWLRSRQDQQGFRKFLAGTQPLLLDVKIGYFINPSTEVTIAVMDIADGRYQLL